MRRWALTCLVLVAAALTALVVYRYRTDRQYSPIADRRPELKRLLAEEETKATRAVAEYQPRFPARLDDLTVPAAGILCGLPSVERVEVLVAVERPERRIIHLRDWHFVPKELFAIDMADAYGRSLTQDEIDQLFEEHLLEAELVQLEQMAILRCLIQHHGLARVFAEGFSPTELDAYREKISVLRAMEEKDIPRIREQLSAVRELLSVASSEGKAKARALEVELIALLDAHKHRLLEMGAAGRLLIANELEAVLPLEDAASLERAKPISPEGRVRLDQEKVQARNDAQVRAVMKEGPVGVIVLGGAHDLSGSIRRQAGAGCEYLRVTTRRYKAIAEGIEVGESTKRGE